jgi:outer membrane protease
VKLFIFTIFLVGIVFAEEKNECSSEQISKMISNNISLKSIKKICPKYLPSNKKNYLSISPTISRYSGTARELVYKENGDKLSELFWETEYANLLGLQISSIGKLSFGASIKINTSAKANMKDYDWLCQYDVYNCTSKDWSHYSYSPNTKVEDINLFKLFIKYRLLDKGVKFSLIGGYRYDYFKWIANNKDTQYIYSSKNGFRDIRYTDTSNSPGITYEQTFSALYGGIETIKDFNMLHIGGKIEFSFLANAEDKDNHHNRKIEFEDKFDDYGNMLDIEMFVKFDIKKNISIGILYNYFKYFENKNGYSEVTKDGIYTGRTKNGTAGIDNESSMLELSLTAKL